MGWVEGEDDGGPGHKPHVTGQKSRTVEMAQVRSLSLCDTHSQVLAVSSPVKEKGSEVSCFPVQSYSVGRALGDGVGICVGLELGTRVRNEGEGDGLEVI